MPLMRSAGAACLVCVCACGLFTPRDVEEPTWPVEDPLGFAQILSNSESTERFTLLDYEDLFHEGLEYVDPAGHSFDKRQVRGRLNTITSKYPDIQVKWEVAELDAQEQQTLDRSGPVTLNTRKYRIWRGSPTVTVVDTATGLADTAYELDYRGEASLKLLYSTGKEAWTIYYWRDAPTGGLQTSFFHPDFSQ